MEENIRRVTCDNCGTITEIPKGKDWNTPLGWYKLTRINLLYRNEQDATIPQKNRLEISYNDPDFCCKKCLTEWMEKKILEITNA